MTDPNNENKHLKRHPNQQETTYNWRRRQRSNIKTCQYCPKRGHDVHSCYKLSNKKVVKIKEILKRAFNGAFNRELNNSR